MCQQLQKEPSVGDVRFTNLMARRAREHKDEGIYLRLVDLEHAVLLCYHDAGWANAPQDPDDPLHHLNHDDEESGRFQEGPYQRSENARGTTLALPRSSAPSTYWLTAMY